MWVIASYQPLPGATKPQLSAAEQAEVSTKVTAALGEPLDTQALVIALKDALPLLANRIDGDQVEALCRLLVRQGELKEV